MGDKGLLQGMAHVRIFCMPEDWEPAAAFYRDSLELTETYLDTAHGVAVFDCGGNVTLGVEQVDPEDKEDGEMVARFTGISFRVGDIASVYDRLSRRGVAFARPPELMAWGGKLAHFRDPSGNSLVQEPSGG